MKLKLVREEFGDSYTLGKLHINDIYECLILEDAVREGEKVYGETAIPYGHYKIEIRKSNRFNRMMPFLVNVPGFVAIEIHPGNTPADTKGCLLTGSKTGMLAGTVIGSKPAFTKLMAKLLTEHDSGGEITIDIVGAHAT